MPSAVNYSKWDALAAELDDEDDAAAARAAAARGAQKAVPQPGSAEYKASVDHHKMSVALMADWTKAATGLDDEKTAHLLAFVTTQHSGVHPDNRVRAGEIVGFVESRGAPALKDVRALTRHAARVTDEGADQAERNQGVRVLDVAAGALNTLAAAEAHGGMRAMFDVLARDGDGDVARKYLDNGFAKEELRAMAAAEANGDALTWRDYGRIVLRQAVIALVAAIIAALLARHYGEELEQRVAEAHAAGVVE